MFFFLTLLLATTCIVGDHVLLLSEADLKKALVDNITHALIAVLSWLIIVFKCHLRSSMVINSIVELLLCGVTASIIDIDHFIMTRSLKLKVSSINAQFLKQLALYLACLLAFRYTVVYLLLTSKYTVVCYLGWPRLLWL